MCFHFNCRLEDYERNHNFTEKSMPTKKYIMDRPPDSQYKDISENTSIPAITLKLVLGFRPQKISHKAEKLYTVIMDIWCSFEQQKDPTILKKIISEENVVHK